MRQLMISLDTKILDEHSAVADRMRAYGVHDVLYILIPAYARRTAVLSDTVCVETTGGGKLFQFVRLVRTGIALIRMHHLECVTTQDPFFTGLAGWILKCITRVPFEVQVHGDFYDSMYYRTSGLKNLVRYYLGLFIIPRADTIRCVGERIKNSLIPRGIPEAKITVQPVRVDTEYIKNYQPRFDVHKKYPSYKHIFLCLGRLDRVKNIPWLVDVFAGVARAHPYVLLLIVGDGSDRHTIEKKITALDISQSVRLEGWTDDPYSYLKTSDCVLFPSLSEGYGMVVMEALAAKCKVIMNDVGVAGFEVQHGERIKIVSVNDKENFLKAIQSICV